MSDNSIKTGVEVVIQRDGKILLGKRLSKAGFGQWGLPGGHLEYGEYITDCAKREVLEETGFVLNEAEFMRVVNDPRDDGHYIHFVFLAKNVSGEPEVKEPDKCEKWDWFEITNLPENIFYGHKKFLSTLANKQFFSDKYE